MGGQKGVRRLPANPGLVQRSRELAIRRLPTSAAAMASVSWPWSRILSSSDRRQILDCNDTELRKRRGIAKHSVLYKAERDQLMLCPADSRPKECHVPSRNCGSRRGSGDHLCQPPVWHHDSLWLDRNVQCNCRRRRSPVHTGRDYHWRTAGHLYTPLRRWRAL